jgi:serine/threonine-protein phosphatase PGAM5
MTLHTLFAPAALVSWMLVLGEPHAPALHGGSSRAGGGTGRHTAAIARSAPDRPESLRAPAARTIYLVRHGAYTSVAGDTFPGPPLNTMGIAQARLAGARFAGLPGRLDAIYASPMTRAHETARIVAADLPGMAVELLPDLAECTPATRRAEIAGRDSPESLARCAARIDRIFERFFIPADGQPRREMMVCHGNVIRYLVTRAMGVPTEAWLEMSVVNASITQILVEPDGRFKVISVGDMGHLPPSMQTAATGLPDQLLVVPPR